MSSSFRLALLAFVCGIVVGVVGARWTASPAAAPVSLTSTARANVPAATPARVNSTINAAESNEPKSDAVPMPEATPSAVTRAAQARKSLDDLVTSLGELPEGDRKTAVMDFIYQMRSLGPAGVQTIRDFLQRGEDIKLTSSWGTSNGRLIEPPTLRVAMLEALNDMKDPAVTEISLDVLRNTPSLMEAALAIRNLEKRSPGTYQADALATVRELMNAEPDETTQPWIRGQVAFDLLRYFKNPELLPAVEGMLEKNQGQLSEYLNSLNVFGEAERSAALQRVLTDPKLADMAAKQGFALLQLDLGENTTRQQMLSLFANRMSPRERDQYLAYFSQETYYNYGGIISGPGRQRGIDQAERLRRAEDKLKFLDQLTPYANTPVLQQRVTEARTSLQNTLKNNVQR